MANVDYAYPLDSIVNYDGNGVPSFDRAVSSLVLRRLYSYLFTNGVMMATDSTALQVGVAEGMKVSVNAGFTVINGALRLFAEPRTLAIQASENQDRIDTVVARLDLNQDVRNIDLYVLKGVSGSSPVRPELTRNDSVYELGLADLYITKNTTDISAERITDTRLDTSRCGVVSSISEFDTSAFYDQIQADLAHFKSENEADFETWSSTQRSAFDAWFANIQDILDEDTAGHLQGEIEVLQSDVSTLQNDMPTKENKRTLVTKTLSTSGWNNRVYSFESTYPNATYDLEQIQPTGTAAQLEAWGDAMIVGNSSGNTITARGIVPTVDIPIMMYVRRK
jgi:hypothetical protein